jgi:SRSO17 transposase
MDLFLNGCPCEAETYWSHVMDEYRYFRRRDFNDIKEKLQCDKIEFSYDTLKFFV